MPRQGYGLLRIRHAGAAEPVHYFVETVEPGIVYLLSLLRKHEGIVAEYRLDLGTEAIPPSCGCDDCSVRNAECDHLAIFQVMKLGGKLPDDDSKGGGKDT